MGGFVSSIAKTIADKAGPIVDMAEEQFMSVSHNFNKTPEGRMLAEDFTAHYSQVKKTAVSALTTQELKAAQALKPKVGIGPTGPEIDLGKIHTQASKIARQSWLGQKDSLGVTLLKKVEQRDGPAAAQSLANNIAFVLKDYTDPIKSGRISKGSNAPYSSFKERALAGGVGLTDTSPSYHPAKDWERNLTSGIYATFSPLMVVPHIATIINGTFGSSPSDFLKGISEPIGKSLRQGIEDFDALVQTGAFTETHLRDAKEWNRFEASGHPQFTGGSAAHIIYSTLHQPGFAKWRDYNLLSGANVGKMTAERAARDFAQNPTNKRLLWTINQFGLDPQKILANQGNLDKDDLSKAVYKFVQDHYFLDNSLSRSKILQSTAVGRILGTYHGYVTRQSKLMAKAMFRDWQERGPASVAKNLAIGSILMPVFGEGIQLVQQAYRGQDAGGKLKKDIENLEGKHGAEAFAMSYLGALSHVGAFGVYSHTLRGAYTHSILKSAAGPLASSTADLIEDVTSGGRQAIKHGKLKNKYFAPVERDLMFDTPGISLLAQFLSHRVLPTKADKPKHTVERELYHHLRNEDASGNPIEKEQ